MSSLTKIMKVLFLHKSILAPTRSMLQLIKRRNVSLKVLPLMKSRTGCYAGTDGESCIALFVHSRSMEESEVLGEALG